MQPIILNDIPFEVDTDRLMASLHVAADSAAAAELQVLIEEAPALARERAQVRHFGTFPLGNGR